MNNNPLRDILEALAVCACMLVILPGIVIISAIEWAWIWRQL